MAYPSAGSVLAIVPTSTSGICEAATAFGSVEPAAGALASPNRCALTIAPTSTVRAGGGAMTAGAFVAGPTTFLAPSRVHVSCTSCQASRTTSKAETASGRSFCHPSARAPRATEASPAKTLIHAQGQLHQVSCKWPSGKAVPRVRHHTDLDDRLSRQLRVIRMTTSRFGQSGSDLTKSAPLLVRDRGWPYIGLSVASGGR